MNKLKKSGSYQLTKTLHKKITDLFWGGFCDDYFTKVQIWKTFNEYGYTLDTHTAVAVDVYNQYVSETGDYTKTLIASTASPFKFNQAVLSALGENAQEDDFTLIELLKNKSSMEVPTSLAALKGKERRFTGVIDKSDMYALVKDFLQVPAQMPDEQTPVASKVPPKPISKTKAAPKAEEKSAAKAPVKKAPKPPVKTPPKKK